MIFFSKIWVFFVKITPPPPTLQYILNDMKKFRQKWLVKKAKFVWRKKTLPSTNIPLVS